MRNLLIVLLLFSKNFFIGEFRYIFLFFLVIYFIRGWYNCFVGELFKKVILELFFFWRKWFRVVRIIVEDIFFGLIKFNVFDMVMKIFFFIFGGIFCFFSYFEKLYLFIFFIYFCFWSIVGIKFMLNLIFFN